MPRFKGRSASACYYCRSQKVKCSGEHPCSKCRAAHRDCIFPSKDRVLTVPESYMRRLENEISLLRSKQSGEGASSQTHGEPEPAQNERLIEDSTTEHFIGKLKGVYSATATQSDPFPRTSTIARASPLCDTTSSYMYIPLGSDTSQTEVFVKLPPHSYAVYLLSQFETFIGSDYHWYRKQHFRARMEATYNAAQAQSVDRTWLCCLSVVLALGESYNDSFAPAFSVDGNEGVTVDNQVIQNEHPVAPPGTKLFEQGLQLLKLTYEQPTVEQIEALNLITFYCYSLNRKKTAYAYAGMAFRLAKLLGISKPSQTHVDLVEQEHRKRVWWTTICMDLMTCTELSLTPAHRFDDRSPESPDSKHLSTDDMEEFSDPQYLAAQVKLCRIKYSILETASEFGTGNMREAHMLIQP